MLEARTGPFLDLNAGPLNYMHLESLSCMKFESFLTRDLSEIFTQKMGRDFDYETFKATELGEKLMDIWDAESLKSCQLTTVGQILGIMVSDQYTGGKTNVSGWGN